MWRRCGNSSRRRTDESGKGRVSVISCVALTLGMLGNSLSAGSQALTPLMPYQEHEKRIRSAQEVAPLTSELFGDSISLYNGATEFVVVDIDLPGNNELPVQIRRRFKVERRSELENFGGFGVWDLDIPYIYGNFDRQVKWNEWNANAADPRRCTPGKWGPPIPEEPFNVGDLFTGIRIHLPGEGDRDLLVKADRNPNLPTDGRTYSYVAQDFTSVSCVAGTVNDYPGEGFVVVTSNGLRYTLNAGRERHGGNLAKYKFNTSGGTLRRRSRTQVFLMASRVEDRHGNWVNYHYSDDRLVAIEGSDGRRIDLRYTGNTISEVSANGRTWRYMYEPVTFGLNFKNHLLTAVTQPDGSSWTYRYEDTDGCTGVGAGCPGMLGPEYHQLDIDLIGDRRCPEPFPGVDLFTLSATHPSGATGRFRFGYERFHRTSTPANSCIPTHVPGFESPKYELSTPDYFDLYSIHEKTLAGPGIPEQSWSYGAFGPVCRNGAACPDRKSSFVWQPDGTKIERIFGIRYGVNDGRLLETRVIAADGSVVKTETTDYVTDAEAPSLPFPDFYGSSYYGPDDPVALRLRPARQTTIHQDGETFQHTVTRFDELARPVEVTKASSLDYGRYRRVERFRFHDNRSTWALGQVHSVTHIDPTPAVVVSQTDYDAADLPWRTYRFGALQQTMAYHPDGSLAALRDGKGNTTTLAAWKRGIPQHIVYADGTFRLSTVDDNGWIRSVTDENGYATRYDYDAGGRITRLDHPEGDTVAWEPTLSSFIRSTEPRYGLPAGHWQRHVNTGNARESTYFDAFWRPVVEERFDATDPGQTLSQSLHRYDALGRKVFQSFPLRGLSTHADAVNGIRSHFDALGRVARQEQDSELGVLTTVTEYLSGFKQRLTNARGYSTLTSYAAYDTPSTDLPVAIAHPEGSFTEIHRDRFGMPVALRRRDADSRTSVSRQYVYDAHRRLCKTIEPETGATVQDYDAAGNVAWSAAGLSLTGALACSTEQANASGRAVRRQYDARNQLVAMIFPDGNGDQKWSYWPDGQVKSIATTNDGGLATNSYSYNKRRLLIAENLIQSDASAWPFSYRYSASGALSEQRYPSGRVIDYAPNALGQPTRAGAFATDVRYFPNGSMASYRYGNGIAHSLSQNARGLLERSRQSTDQGAVLDDSYDYDGNGNVLAISDGLSGSRGNRDMSYDGLDRLKTAASPMFGNAQYHYDVLDNLLSVRVADRDHSYSYDARNHLTNVVDAGTGATLVGLRYDDQGNLSRKNGQSYQFDFGNRLREVVDKERYRYDGHGRRIRAVSPSLGDIVSVYDRKGALRVQHNTRMATSSDYILLNGTQVARVDGLIAPAAPTITLPGYSTDGAYAMQWSAVPAAQSYELQESENGAAWSTIVTGTAREHAVTGKAQGYVSYQARACNAAGCGRWSVSATIFIRRQPGPSGGVSAPLIGPSGTYSITWLPPIPRETGPTTYALEEAREGAAWGEVYSGPELVHAISGKPAGTYHYRLKACNPYGCSDYVQGGNPVTVIYPPPVPEGLRLPQESLTGSYGVSWHASVNASSYRLDEAFNGGTWTQVHHDGATVAALTGRQTGRYQYRVRACNSVGCSAHSGLQSIAVTVAPTYAPSISAPANSGSGSFDVSWSEVHHAASYQLFEQNGGGTALIQDGASRARTVAGKGSGSWGYVVRACNRGGCGPLSPPGAVQVLRIPDVPSITRSMKLQTDNFPIRIACAVSWTPISHAARYELRAYSNGQLYQLQYDGPSTSVGGSWLNYYEHTRHCASQHVVRSCNATGCSAWSAPVTQYVEIIPTDPGGGIPIRRRAQP